MPHRLYIAWRLHFGLNYPWRLAWHRAAYPAVSLRYIALCSRISNRLSRVGNLPKDVA